MEDAVLGNSKGATYKSFILDVEIVIRKEGTANVAKGRVKRENSKKSDEESKDKGGGNVSQRSKKEDVYLVAADQTNLRDINNQPKNDVLTVENSNSLNTKNTLSNDLQTSISSENTMKDEDKQQQTYKNWHSHKRNPSETLSEKKHHKKKRTHKSVNTSNMFKGKVEPVDFLECNRIFMCNYLQLPRRNSDSALYCDYLGTLKKILQQEYIDTLDEQLQQASSVCEIVSLLKPNNSLWNETTNKTLCSSTKYLSNIYSGGDCNVTNNFEKCETNFERFKLTKNTPKKKTNIADIELLHNYLKDKFLKEQTIKTDRDPALTNINNVNLQYNLSSISPSCQCLATLKDTEKVESLPNIKIECKNHNSDLKSYEKDSEDQELTDDLIPADKCEKYKGDSIKYSSNLELKCCVSNNGDKSTLPPIITKEVVEMKTIKHSHFKMKSARNFFQRIRSVKKNLSFFQNPINLNQMRRIFKKT